MRFRLISKESWFCSLMYRLADQKDADCLTYIESEKYGKCYDGLLKKVKSPIELGIRAGDTVIFDANGAGSEADLLRKKGYYVVGGGSINDKLEFDRTFGLKFMTDHGIRVPKSYTFSTFDEMEKFIAKHPDRYVFKPSGDTGPSSSNLTYVSSSPENMMGMLPYLKEACSRCQITEFTLQVYTEGVEMSTEAWFNGKKFLQPLNSTFEEKKFMEGGKGPQTGCMGSVVWNWDAETSEKLYHMLFEKMEGDLANAGYMGPLDVNAIWTPSGPLGLEFTPRFGYDAIQNFSRTLSIPFGEFLSGLGNIEAVPIREDWIAIAVGVSTPPFPTKMPEMPKVPILGITPKDILDTVYLADACVQDGVLRTTGADNWALSVVDDGASETAVHKKIYKKIEAIELSDKQYRMDIGDRYVRDRGIVQRLLRA